MAPKTLAEIVLEDGLLDAGRVELAEKHARRCGEPLVVALVELERAPELAVASALRRHLKMDIVDPARETVEPDAVRELPHELCRRRRVLPLALEERGGSGRTLRLAMADPTDAETIAEIEETTGCRVEPLLATLSGVEDAISRAYRGLVTAVMKRDGDDERSPRIPFGGNLAPKTGEQAPPGPTTQPYHQIQDEVPIELRHQALLDLLLDKGVITVDEYQAEIRKLLNERE